MKKARLSVYLDPDMMAQLIELADRKRQSKSLIAEAAITSFLTPDDADRREAAVTRRLDLLVRQGERVERDLWIAAETLALFIRFWLTALRRGSADSLNQTGQQVVRRNLNIQPTITIRPGFPVRVIVNRDLVLAPYRS
jgi:Bacterial conjugation TrbI-like protein/Ribbon-helix-helix protein, copG family